MIQKTYNMSCQDGEEIWWKLKFTSKSGKQYTGVVYLDPKFNSDITK